MDEERVMPRFTKYRTHAACPFCGICVYDSDYPEETLEQCPKCGVLIDIEVLKNNKPIDFMEELNNGY